jgi:Ni/Fe-hydrogenase subunit HybB-like protein
MSEPAIPWLHLSRLDSRGVVFWGFTLGLFAVAFAGYWAAHTLDVNGHILSGMNNRMVWGLPHIVAIFLIVSASGALNVASLSSVFGNHAYRSMAPLSGVLAIALLCGGLAILVLDLGRPERVLVTMLHYNFKSIFAWNIFLYTGFIVVVAAYLVTLADRRFNRFVRAIGWVAFLWRLVLTTATGSIFGFLVAREAFDAAVMAPLFVAVSLSAGLAVFLAVSLILERTTSHRFSPQAVDGLVPLQAAFIGAVAYFVAVFHLTNAYAREHWGLEAFLLFGFSGGADFSGGSELPGALLFWVGYVMVGTVTPLVLLVLPATRRLRGWRMLSVLAVIIGTLSLLGVIIIGGQSYPPPLLPGKEVVTGSFPDGQLVSYTASHYEWMLGLGGVGFSLLIVVAGMKLLPVLPAAVTSLNADTS